jgi:hypothetical protein
MKTKTEGGKIRGEKAAFGLPGQGYPIHLADYLLRRLGSGGEHDRSSGQSIQQDLQYEHAAGGIGSVQLLRRLFLSGVARGFHQQALLVQGGC